MFGRPFNIGFVLLGIYLILVGLTSLIAVGIPSIFLSILLGVLALLAGIFIIMGR